MKHAHIYSGRTGQANSAQLTDVSSIIMLMGNLVYTFFDRGE